MWNYALLYGLNKRTLVLITSNVSQAGKATVTAVRMWMNV